MGGQALPLGKVGYLVGYLGQGVTGVVGELGLLHEIIHRQRGGEAGGAAGGQGVVGACEVVAQSLGAVLAHEDGACVLDLVQIVEGVVHAQLQMLGSDLVGDVNGQHEVSFGYDDLAVLVNGLTGYIVSSFLFVKTSFSTLLGANVFP